MDDLVKQLMHATVSIDGDFDVGCNVRDAAVERLERAGAAVAVIRRLVAALEYGCGNCSSGVVSAIADAKAVTDRV